MDFFKIKEIIGKDGSITIYPDFIVGKTKDIMVRGRNFYAIWDEELGMWSKDQYDVVRLVDQELLKRYSELKENYIESKIKVKTLSDFSTGSWDSFCKYLNRSPDNSRQLDTKVTFQNDIIKRTDYVSKRVPYAKEQGDISAYEKLMDTLYLPEERQKIEWAIGSIIKGDGKKIQKFLVFYGPAGAGKSTVLNIIQELFQGYYTTFDAKELTSAGSSFATDAFANDPLIAIQHDGDLSGIKDNSKLNSIVSHEEIIVNEKFKARYSIRANCFLFMGTNKPVKITDGKSGIIRRLIDVKPTGNKVEHDIYDELMNEIEFELGAIAAHCEDIYAQLGKNYYDTYKPLEMMFKTDPFFNFVEDQYYFFKEEDGVSLKQAYSIYKEYCKESGAEYVLQMYKFREELKNYFENFEDMHYDGDIRVRSYYSGFLADKFKITKPEPVKGFELLNRKDILPDWLHLDSDVSKLDILYKDCPAQYATEDDKPSCKWDNVKTTLKDINTKKVHYVRVPDISHIVLDFDLKNDAGEKDMQLNLKAAKAFPKTYAELSKGGGGLHLHYIYKGGDPHDLANVISEGIEVKVFTGLSSLRRRLSKCNNEDISEISSGLPRKEKKKVVNFNGVTNEKIIRKNIIANLQKKVHPYTKPSIDMIKKILDDAYESGINYDVSDMYTDILMFAYGSTHQKDAAVKVVEEMHFKSDDISRSEDYKDQKIIFYDVEVFPNLFVLCYKVRGKESITACINPKRSVIENILQHRLVGYNCRRYDNHILYAWLMGYNNEQLFKLSQRIINNSDGFFGEAYNLSYADIYDFSSKKQSLKKWEIELGIHHKELGLPWDQPVPPELWNKVADYCKNDVVATEATWDSPSIQEDFVARQVLADISGLTVNDTTRLHTTKIIFGDEKHPELVYTDLSKMFPGYKYEFGHSTYRGEDPGEGGYVYAEPGMYTDVALLDIASMHPTSIEELNLFGKYTQRFSDIKQARIYIKHKEFDKAGELLNGAFKPYLTDESKAPALAQALKIIINSVYGYTTATFDNPFKDIRNVDNIVAKRGALFMINLKHEVQDRGFTVAHIKTDSIKIPHATPEIIQFVMDYGKQYGYTFEHEATYSKLCLVNNAVYIAKEKGGEWTATGAQFKIPYVFKTLFSKEPLTFDDFCETKSVTTELYLDFNERLPEGEHNYIFVGKVGRFTPVKPGQNGGLLMRKKDDKYYAATGSTGYRWFESETIKNRKNWKDIVDESYYINQAVDARNDISKFGDFEWFTANSDEPLPWV